MKIILSSKYYETRANLREKIRKGSIQVQELSPELQKKEHACFFCLDQIKGRTQALIESYTSKDKQGKLAYPICGACNETAKKYIYLPPYDMPFSLN